jgi:hypothetical protein
MARDLVMPGWIPVSFSRDPSFAGALAVEGAKRTIWVARSDDTGEAVGYATVSSKPVWINGRPEQLGYLSNLRLRPEWRGGRLLARGFRTFIADSDHACRLYCTTILRENRRALSLLGKTRRTAPRYHPAGIFHCRAVSPRRLAGARHADIRPATPNDLPDLVTWLADEGAQLQFFPRYRAEDFADGALLQGLKMEDILLLHEGGRIAGCIALWDQRSFRQVVIPRYPPVLRLARPLISAAEACTAWPPLPPPGRPAPLAYASLICIRDRDPARFRTLLAAAARHAADRWQAIVLGAHESDPLAAVVASLRGLDFSSHVFLVTHAAAPDAINGLDHRPVYLETGSL